ncbi:MAG TPA: DUF2911 domain-containing protein [Polyangia bacterium]|nr:DUF2911 domain-containing protein [Polyangia bacterium]
MTSRTVYWIALALPMLAASPALAQLELPRPSPLGKVSQVVGMTEISVEYSSPAVRGRKIWGGLLPYDKLWRTGANAATKITFSKDATVAGKAVPAGTYAVFTIPSKNEWTVILNKNPNQGGTDSYKQELDLMRFAVKPRACPHREHLTFLFSEFSENAATLDLEWEKLRVSIPIKVGTDVQALANIAAIEEGVWRQYNAAARYMLEQKKDYEAGLKLIEKSLAVKEDWLNVWTKASLLAAKGKYKEAYPLAERALALGQKAPAFFFQDEVKKALDDWKKKL